MLYQSYHSLVLNIVEKIQIISLISNYEDLYGFVRSHFKLNKYPVSTYSITTHKSSVDLGDRPPDSSQQLQTLTVHLPIVSYLSAIVQKHVIPYRYAD